MDIGYIGIYSLLVLFCADKSLARADKESYQITNNKFRRENVGASGAFSPVVS
jgi:hypothetical protein